MERNDCYHYFEGGQKILRIPCESDLMVNTVRTHQDYQFELAADLGREPVLCKCRRCAQFGARLQKNKAVASARPR